MAAGGLFSYQQQKAQAENQAAQMRAQANAQRAQAVMYDNAAKAEQHKQSQIADNYAQESAQLRDRRRAAQASAVAQAGSAGIGINGTSALDILTAGSEAYMQDRINLLNNQRNDNYNSRVAESGFINQGNAARTSARNLDAQASAVANVSPLPTILGTAAQIYGMEYVAGKNVGSSKGSGFDFGTSYNLATGNTSYAYTGTYKDTANAFKTNSFTKPKYNRL